MQAKRFWVALLVGVSVLAAGLLPFEPALAVHLATVAGTPLFLPDVQNGAVSPTGVPVTALPTPSATRASTGQPTLTPTNTRTPTPTATATRTPTRTATATTHPVGNPLACAVTNIAWTDPGKLLRSGNIGTTGFACLAAAGVNTLVDIREPAYVPAGEAQRAADAGLEYVNRGIQDDHAPSPVELQGWLDTVDSRLASGKVVLVYDAAGRGRMGVWDAIYLLRAGGAAGTTIENRYIGRAFSFNGAKIDCPNGGNGQVQALADIGSLLTGVTYYPTMDEWGNPWTNCPRPAYMNGWSYAPVFGP